MAHTYDFTESEAKAVLLLAFAAIAGIGYSIIGGGAAQPSFRDEYRKSDSMFAVLASAVDTPGLRCNDAATTKAATIGATQDCGRISSKRVNINTAGVEELDELPGIGPVIAQRIVEYRTEHGRFASPEELLEVKSIGRKKFERLKLYIRINE